MSSKSPRRSQRQQAQDRARRKRQLLLGGLVGAAALVALVLVMVLGSGKSEQPADRPLQGRTEVAQLLQGVPQRGMTLGKAKAPLTLVEFADLQCPYCRKYSLYVMPVLIQDYVRTGKLRMKLELMDFVGGDSHTAALAAFAAAKQSRGWNFADLFYFNQGQENSSYVTDAFLRKVYRGAGVNVIKAEQLASQPETAFQLSQSLYQSRAWGVDSTPSFVLGRTGGKLTRLQIKDPGKPDELRAAIDALLADK